jgi:hypothetical protein
VLLRESVVLRLQRGELGLPGAPVVGELLRLRGELTRRAVALAARQVELLAERVYLELKEGQRVRGETGEETLP